MDVEEQRQPVKKRRRNGERVRVTRACDYCKNKKLRCTGTPPCASCTRTKQPCTFKAEYHRGKAYRVSTDVAGQGHADVITCDAPGNGSDEPSATPRQQEDSRPSLVSEDTSHVAGRRDSSEHAEQAYHTSRSDQAPSNNSIQPYSLLDAVMPDAPVLDSQALPDAGQIERSSRNSPEPPHTDLEGHYLGPASGVAFLSRALKKLRRAKNSASAAQPSIFNFADAAMPQFDPYFLILPAKEEAKSLIRHYFDYASPTHRYLHQPTIDVWCNEFYESIRNHGPLKAGAHEKRAIILALFAVAKQFSQRSSSFDSPSDDYVDSAIFFAASEHHLRLEPGGIRLTSIQARLIQCFLLLSQSKVNSAWSLFGTVANLVLAIGLHRRKKRDSNGGMDLIEHECRKRVFWSAYILDNYLSAGLGRPRSFHEEDLDQELPLCVDDWQITPLKVLPHHEAGPSLTQASIYHAKLLKIVSGILRDLYGLKRLPPDKQEQTLTLYDNRLTQWREEIASFLDIVNPDVMMPIFRRQHTVLHLAHSHAVIMLHRQGLLAKPPATNLNWDNTTHGDLPYGVQSCLDAATLIVTKLRKLMQKNQMYSALWFTHYYVFSALVALYLYVIQNRSKAAHLWEPYLDLAQQGLRDLTACSADQSYCQRYVVVLAELQVEAMKTTEDDIGSAVVSRSVQPMTRQPSTTLGLIPNSIDRNTHATNAIMRDSGAGSQEIHATVGGLGVHTSQLPPFRSSRDIYGNVNDTLTPQALESQDDYHNLELEGLADLAFMFSVEDTSRFQIVDTV